MSSVNGNVSRGDLVPLADRVRYMQVFRLFVAAAVLGVAMLSGDKLQAGLVTVAAVTAAYLVVTSIALAVTQLPRGLAVALFGATLMVDGIFLAWAPYVAGGNGSPARVLALLHLMTVALLASYRTGMKLAVWHTLLLVVAYYGQQGGLLRPVSEDTVPLGVGTPFQQLIAFSIGFGFVAIAAASFSAVNERELRRRRYDLEALAGMATSMEQAADSESVAGTLVSAVVDTLGFERALLVGSPGGAGLQVLSSHGAEPAPPVTLPPRSILSDVLANRHTRLVSHVETEPNAWLAAALPGARNVMVVPLATEGQAVGALIVEHFARRGSRVERRLVATLERFCSYGAVALRNAWLLDEVQRLAVTDALTGLSNRVRFQQMLEIEIERATRQGGTVGVVMVDLDNFKALNDTAGHQAGDEALRRAADAIASSCRPFDVAGRYGGEEFAVLLPGADAASTLTIADRLRLAIRAKCVVTASVGAAVFPVDGTTPDALLGAADVALYESKRTGRDRVTLATN